MSIFSLEGKIAYVTGASKGIGRAIGVGLAQHGADVALAARSVEGLEETAELVRGTGRRALVVECDVTDTAAVESSVARTIKELGGLDIVVNNAGGTRFSSPLIGMREDGWHKVIDLNLSSVFRVCKAVGAHLLNQGRGSVINVASVEGVQPTPLRANYSSAKAGLIAMTRVLAQEWAPIGVRVNALSPGAVDTELWGALAQDENYVKMTLEQIPMGRWAQPDEMVGAAVFLASEASSYVTGANLIVDGGWTA